MISSSDISNSNLPPQGFACPPLLLFPQGQSWILKTSSCLLTCSTPSLLPYLIPSLSSSHLSPSSLSGSFLLYLPLFFPPPFLFSLPTSLSHSLPPSHLPILFFLLFRLIIVFIWNTVGVICFSLLAVFGHPPPLDILIDLISFFWIGLL